MNTRQLTTTNTRQLAHWTGATPNPDGTLTFRSREGTRTAHPGQWITDTHPGAGTAWQITDDRPA